MPIREQEGGDQGPASGKPGKETMENRRMKIMVVDDEVEIQNSISRYLSFMPEFDDVDVITASGFDEALERLEKESPLIILQDINLPDGNGLQMIRQVKKTYPMIQFIVITGASDLDRAMEALSYGAADYIKKPINMELLGDMVMEAKKRCDRWGDLLWEEYAAEQEA